MGGEAYTEWEDLGRAIRSGKATADEAYRWMTHEYGSATPTHRAAVEILHRATQAAEAPQFRPLSEMPDEYRDGREVLLRLPMADPESNTVEWIVARWQEVFVNSGELESLWVSAIDDHDCFGDYAPTGWSPILSMRPEEV